MYQHRLVVAMTLLVACSGSRHDALVAVTDAGAMCPDGGVMITSGIDTNGNGQLDPDEVTSTQYVCGAPGVVICTTGAILTGTVTISSDADWAKLADIDCVDGDLLITGTPSTAIEASSLTTVTGDLIIAGNANVTSLDGISAVTAVGGTYLVQANDSLTQLKGLSSLKQAGRLSIVGNSGLTDLSGLEGFSDLHFDVLIEDNQNLTSLNGLDGLQTSTRQLLLLSNPGLMSVDALSHTRSLFFFQLSGSPSLTDATFSQLAKVDERLLFDTDSSLTHISLPALVTVGDITQITDCGALLGVDAPVLRTGGGFIFQNDNSLQSISAPALLFSTAALTFTSLPALTSLDMTSLTAVATSFTLNTVPLLADFKGLAALHTVGGDFLVTTDGGIQNFNGLDMLQTVSGSMTITADAQLQSFAGLGALTDIGGSLTISNNVMLPPGAATTFAAGVTVRGIITIH